MRSRNRRRGTNWRFIVGILIIGILCFVGSTIVTSSRCNNEEIEQYANSKGIKTDQYTKRLVALFERNPETKKFVFEYPQKKNKVYTIDLAEYKNCKKVPLLMQWDQRWGYASYAGDMIGLSGCGPTCMSMVTIYLTGDTKWNPRRMAEYATDNGYVKKGKGTTWKFFTSGAKAIGLDVIELPLRKTDIVETLKRGHPIICSMGPGDFTSSGHFIVLTGYEKGKIRVNDPNSIAKSKVLWDYDEIVGQIKNLWAFGPHKS